MNGETEGMRENGKGELYFGDQVYHMFDFMEDGAEEVLHLGLAGCRFTDTGMLGTRQIGNRIYFTCSKRLQTIPIIS